MNILAIICHGYIQLLRPCVLGILNIKVVGRWLNGAMTYSTTTKNGQKALELEKMDNYIL